MSLVALLMALSSMIPRELSQRNAPDLLQHIVSGSSPSQAEQKLEQKAQHDADTRKRLDKELPVALANEKDLERVWLLAKLAGALQVQSAIGPLSELLKRDTKHIATTFYQTAELTDDPVGSALVEIGPPSVAPVAALLESANPKTRVRAIRILAKIGTQAARDDLARARAGETDPTVLLVLGEVSATK